MEEKHQKAADLLGLIWKGTPAEYKSRYRRTIWQQFEDQVRSAAYTSNAGKFLNSLCLKLGADLGTNAEDRVQTNQILGSIDGRELLRLLREETTLIVLMVRVANQGRQEEARARREENEAIEAASGELFREVN
jgi:hypothetical protein